MHCMHWRPCSGEVVVCFGTLGLSLVIQVVVDRLHSEDCLESVAGWVCNSAPHVEFQAAVLLHVGADCAVAFVPICP